MKKGFTLIELLIVIAIIAILALIAIPNFLEAQTRGKIARAMADERTIATAIEAYFVDYNAYPYYYNRDDGTAWAGDVYGESTFVPYSLTTPVAYLTRLMPTPFPPQKFQGATDARPGPEPTTYMYRRFFNDMTVSGSWKPWPGPGNRPKNQSYDWGYGLCASWVPVLFDSYFQTGWFLKNDGNSANYLRDCSGQGAWVIGCTGPTLNFVSLGDGTGPAWYSVPRPTGSCTHYDPTNGTVSMGDILRFNAR